MTNSLINEKRKDSNGADAGCSKKNNNIVKYNDIPINCQELLQIKH
jgi:hypothetical protein